MIPGPVPIAQECVEGYLYAVAPLRLLLFRRPPARGRYWVPVSGKVDPTDPSWEAALRRELSEETGLSGAYPLEPLDWHVAFRSEAGPLWRLHAYAVRVDPAFVPRLSEEHDAFAWYSAEAAIEALHFPDNQDAVRRLRAVAAGRPATV
ncbi:MAG TPA: NUDIX domain-containing protein [Thermoplasmata archaeon]|nr:NUDIX domain-containing protein [Thermoplasmata archaeon]